MSDRPPFSPTVALLAIARQHDAAFAAALKPLGLSSRKYGMLGHLTRDPGISFSELARRSHISVQSAHAAVAALVSAGLVDDSTAQAGSASTLRLTAAGASLLRRATAELDRLDAQFAATHPALTEGLRRHVTGLFDRSP
ncbi:MarR family winged helix-turn-helix transcriptional regulator [Gordonia sp. CPCC 205333]|uniref:MarR family winged helix-turn-helix transcriptional regulator n=1 Tax=Gordonia sp. CPCC 205333 TaxID=3140790 RepID=UPI003AF37F98